MLIVLGSWFIVRRAVGWGISISYCMYHTIMSPINDMVLITYDYQLLAQLTLLRYLLSCWLHCLDYYHGVQCDGACSLRDEGHGT